MKITLFAEFIEPEKRRPNLARMAVGLAVTLVFHGFLIYAVVTAKFEVKIVTFKQKATRVYLAPATKVKLSRDYERQLARLPQPGSNEGLEFFESGRPAGGAAGSGGEGASAESGGSPAEASAPAGQAVGPSGKAVIPGEASSGFVLSYKPGSEKGKVPDLDLSLPGRTLAQQRRGSGRPVTTDPRLKSYPGADFSSVRGGAGGSGPALARSRTGDRVIYRGKLPPGVPGEMLTVWGRQAVETIQKNWILPTTKKDRVEGKVGLTVTVEKDGRASAVRLINSSNISLLDRSAVAAIAASLPFPRLPEAFPGESLEAYFLFDCYAK